MSNNKLIACMLITAFSLGTLHSTEFTAAEKQRYAANLFKRSKTERVFVGGVGVTATLLSGLFGMGMIDLFPEVYVGKRDTDKNNRLAVAGVVSGFLSGFLVSKYCINRRYKMSDLKAVKTFLSYTDEQLDDRLNKNIAEIFQELKKVKTAQSITAEHASKIADQVRGELAFLE